MSPELQALQTAIEGQDREIADLRQKLVELIKARNSASDYHNSMLGKEQLAKWKEEGKAPCVECHHLVPASDLSYILVRKSYSPGSYGGEEPPSFNKIKRVCPTCRQKIMGPHFHAGYPLRYLAEKREDGFYVFHQGDWRPIVFINLGRFEVEEEVPLVLVCKDDFTPIAQPFS